MNIAHTMRAEDVWWGGQWCYVSSECKKLGLVGRKVPDTDYAFKICDERDPSLRHVAPMEIAAMQRQGKFNVSLTHMYTFAYQKWHQSWGAVRDDFMSDSDVRADVRRIKKSGQAYFIQDGHEAMVLLPGFKIVQGDSVYSVDLAKRGWELAATTNSSAL